MRKTYIPKHYHRHQQVKSRSKSRNIIIILLKFIMFLVVVGGIGYILYSPILNVLDIQVKVEDEALRSEINTKTKDIVIENKSWWYNNENILLLRSNKLIIGLLQEFSQIKNIEIKRNLFNMSIELSVDLRTPIFYGCRDGVCYNIGEDGVNMGVIYSTDANLVEIKGLQLDKEGQTLLSEREIIWLNNIIKEYNNIDNIKITTIDINQKSGNDIVSILVYTEKGYYIMLDLDTDIIYQAQVLKQVFISQLPVEKHTSLEYIDLRIKDRAYYKFK